MWIRVQKKDILVDVSYIQIDKALLKKGKSIISGYTAGFTMPTTLGEFESYEEAKMIFEEIQNNIAQGTRLYTMI